MVFSSALFLTLFLPFVLGMYFLAQEKWRNLVLLTASLFFYAWGEPAALFVMIFSIILCYFAAQAIQKYSKWARLILALGVIIHLLILIYYKYWMFLLENLNRLFDFWELAPVQIPFIALPIGISFYTFQIISYLIDVYRGQVPAQKNLISLATYISLFPQLVAGPIVRYETVMKDMENRHTRMNNIFIGLRRFVVGLAKKVLIADQMAVIADTVFNTAPENLPCCIVWIGTVAYALQIFYDFSGYSDMAIGIGRIFNFKFLENFNYPYSAHSVQDFWRKWHISLSTWFRDYLYIPLGGNRCSQFRTYLNGFIVFGLCDLWHGATWNFIVWGLYHGFFLSLEKAGLKKLINRLPCVFANLYVWIFVLIGWVIFRSETLSQAKKLLKIMLIGNPHVSLAQFYPAADFLSYSFLWVFLAGLLFSYPLVPKKYAALRYSKADCVIMLFLFFITYVFAITSTFSPFIYFRF